MKTPVIYALALIMLVGLLFRFEDLSAWKTDPDRAFYNGEPILTAFDGYKYLCYARDLLEDTYEEIEVRRDVPRRFERPEIPPPISSMAASAVSVSGIPLNWVAAMLPPLLGILVALPVFGLGLRLEGRLTGLVAATIMLLSPHYIGRTGLGRFDTDCLNVFFVAAMILSFMNVALLSDRRRWVWLVVGLIMSGLFMMWWDVASEVALGVSCLALLPVLFFNIKWSARKVIISLLVLAALIGACLLIEAGGEFLGRMIRRMSNFYKHVAKVDSPLTPNIANTIGEQMRPSFTQAALWTVGSRIVCLLSLIGLIGLTRSQGRKILFLLPLLVLGVMAVMYSSRLLIFLTPLLSLGLGYFVSRVWECRKRFRWLTYAVPIAVLCMVGNLYAVNRNLVQWPVVHSRLVAGLEKISKVTPEDAVIWGLWDHGHLINYYARRATVADGGLHSGARIIYASQPLATDHPRYAANFTQFYVQHGERGIEKIFDATGGYPQGFAALKKILSASRDEREQMLASDPVFNSKGVNSLFQHDEHRPVYLLFDERLAVTSDGWATYGNWSFSGNEAASPSLSERSMFNLMYNQRIHHDQFFASLIDDHPYCQVWQVLAE